MTARVLPPAPRWLRMTALAIGVSLLLWLPFEDTSVNSVLVFAAAISGWWALRFLVDAPASGGKTKRRLVLLGALAGLAISPIAFLLMAVKTGLHGHPSPDFAPEQLHAVLISTPAWIAAGILLGLGSGLWRANRRAEDARSG